MKTEKVARFQSGKVSLKIGKEGEIGSDGSESGSGPLAENNPNLTDCPISRKNSNVVQIESAKDTNVGQMFALNVKPDAEEEPTIVSIVNESEDERGEESIEREESNPDRTSPPVAVPLSNSASEENLEKEDLVTPEQGTSQLQENGDSGYETSAPLDDGRSNLRDGIKEAPEGILGLKTDLEIFPEDDHSQIGEDGNKVAIGEEYENKYDADEFEPDDEE